MSRYLFFVIIFIICIISVRADDDDDRTKEMLKYMTDRYGEDVIAGQLPCLMNTECWNCTSKFSCVWTAKSLFNGIQVSQGGTLIKGFENVRYCWTGGFAGGYSKQVFLGGDQIDAVFGWNDYVYQQCQIRGGVAILLIVFFVIAAVCAVICFILCCIVFFGHQCRKKKNAYYKQKDER